MYRTIETLFIFCFCLQSKQIHDDSDEKFIVTIQDADTDLENFFKFVDIINENIGKMDKLVDDMVRIQLKMMAISNEDGKKPFSFGKLSLKNMISF